MGLSWADSPRGDLNHDGKVHDPATDVLTWISAKPANEAFAATQDGEAHFYAECSDMGTCDRVTGLCMCRDGFEGASCQRSESFRCTLIRKVLVTYSLSPQSRAPTTARAMVPAAPFVKLQRVLSPVGAKSLKPASTT